MPLLLTTLLLSLSTSLTPPPPTPLTSALVIEPLGRGGRAPTFTDAIEHAIATGAWSTPNPGDQIPAPDSGPTRTWRAITADPDTNALSDPALRGGYALITVTSPADRVTLLDARGHRHVLINGAPRVGDAYDLGITRIPIKLRRGQNELLFRAGRGRLSASLIDPPAPVFIEPRDRTLPDILVGTPTPLHAAVIITNATDEPQSGWTLTATAPAAPPIITRLPTLLPLQIRKAPFTIQTGPVSTAPEAAGAKVPITLELRDPSGALVHEDIVELNVRDSSDKHVRTFVSGIDGSVQYFAVVPPLLTPDSPELPALVLSLHGASVEATNQAGAYKQKDWAYIICPTNRRPFGFDWEDWGRLDAMEVLTLAEELLPTDPRRVYLTGHSMGGHGAWQVGVHAPGRFAAIAPCASWPDFWSYGGAAEWPDPTPVDALLSRAVNPSRTLLLERNLAPAGVFIYHGDADTTVPVSIARTMRDRLEKFHTDLAYHEAAGDGHWAGDHAVDYPPLFDFFRQRTLLNTYSPTRVSFTTPSPAVNATMAWVTIESQLRSLDLSSVDAAFDPAARTLTITTDNVARLSLDLSPLSADVPLTVTIDGQTVEGPAGVPFPQSGRLHLARITSELDIAWELAQPPSPAHKSPARSGPFKDAFRNHVLFVYGTIGAPEETAANLAKARYDAETFWYRGNGSIDILPDSAFSPADHPDRSIILYGNADTNAAWPLLLKHAPFSVNRGRITIAGRTTTGDNLALLAVFPRPDSPTASVAVVAGSGLPGQLLTNQLPYFVSGVAYPDWTLLSTDMLTTTKDPVKAAGFFAQDWTYDPAQSAWLE